MSEMHTDVNQELKKDSVSKTDVIIMSVSAAAPAMCLGGSFGTFMQGAGTAVSLAFLLATIVIVMVGWNYGQLSSRYNSAGGTYSYVRSVLGARAGFVSGWIYMGVNVCTGVIGAIFATYLHELIPAIPIWLGVLILLVPIFFVGWNGVEMTSKALIVVWAVQMVLILYPAIKVIALRAGVIENVAAHSMQAFVSSYGISGLMLAVLVCVWSFVGFECPAYMGEEIRGGNRSVKIAITVSGAAIGLIYIIACWLWTAVALFGAYVNADILFTMMALFASVSYVLICAANIKDRWKENSPASILSNKVIPVIASVILIYMIFSSSPVYIAATAVWTLVAWLASFLWKGAAAK